MKTYSIKEIADLHAVQESRKDENTVTEAERNKFQKKTPKYISIAAKSLAAMVSAVSIPLDLKPAE
jgi:hypothetical protein